MGLAVVHLPGADRGMQKPEFWLGERVIPLSRPQLASLCDGDLQRKLCLLVPRRRLFLRCTIRCLWPCRLTRRLLVRGSGAARVAGQPYLDLVQGPIHLHSLHPHRHSGLAVGQVPAGLGLTL